MISAVGDNPEHAALPAAAACSLWQRAPAPRKAAAVLRFKSSAGLLSNQVPAPFKGCRQRIMQLRAAVAGGAACAK